MPHHSAAWRIDRSAMPVTSAVLRGRPLLARTRRPASKPTVCCSMKSWSSQSFSIIRCRTPAKSAASRPGLDRQEQVAGARDRRDARVDDDDLRARLARLPDVVGGDRRALGDVRAGDPDHLGAEHVGPRVGRAVDAERLLVRRAGADHAEPAVVVDVRRLQAHAGELAHQVGLLGRQARAAEHAEGVVAVASFWMRSISRRDASRSPRRTASARKPPRRDRIAPQRGEQPVGVRALQVALHALRAEHAAVEREVLPRLEADDLVVLDLELDAALLAAEAAVRLDEPVGLDAVSSRSPRHARDRCGPNCCDDRSRSSTGTRGHVVHFESVPWLVHSRALREAEQRAPAARADPLVVLAVASGHLVAEAELPLDLDQVLDMHRRRERLRRSAGSAPARPRAPTSL